MNCIHISATQRDNGGDDGGGDGGSVAPRRREREERGARRGEEDKRVGGRGETRLPVDRGSGRVEKGGYRRAR